MAFEVGNILGFWAFSALIPLIILYLIRPRPTNLKVPSLMFFFARTKSTTAESILRYFHEDLLFIIQLIVLSILALSLTQPLLTVKRDAVSSNIVFVLDVSASSKVMEDGKTRFEIEKEKIKELATTRNSLVLIKSNPVLALQGVGRSELVRYLDRLQVTDDLSDIASAMILAGELLSDTKGRVVVLSDLVPSKGVSIGLAHNILEGKGVHVDFITPAKNKRSNFGIINMVLTSDSANVYVKNYNNKDEDVDLRIGNELKTFNIKTGSVEPQVFSLVEGDMEVEILNKDDFSVDNKVVITRPYGDEIKVMLITNNPSQFLKAALNAIDKVKLTVAEPPVIPKGDFDVYAIYNMRKDALLEGTFEDLKDRVESGNGNMIIVSWLGVDDLDFKGLLPLEFEGKVNGGAINIDQITRFTRDIDFGEVKSFYKVKLENGVSIASFNGSSVAALFEVGKGKVVYYGIMDSESDFKLSPNYPIFWNNLIAYLAGRADLNELNFKTGSNLEVSNTTTLNLDKTGIFNILDKKISVNLLNERESDVNFRELYDLDVKPSNYKLESVKVQVDYNLDFYLVLLALTLCAFEFGYIKFRGEI